MPPHDTHLHAAILELTGREVDAQLHLLAAFEKRAAGLVAAHPDGSPLTLTSQLLLRPGAPPGAVCDGALIAADTVDAAFTADGHAAAVAIYLRDFAARQCALVERALHGRLLAVWEALADASASLQWHFIVTVRRDAEMDAAHPIHADTFDGSMAAFALLSTKTPTPIYPCARFEPAALARFVAESAGPARPADVGVAFRPDVIRVAPGAEGARRAANSAALVILPGAVAHSVPDSMPRARGTATVDSTGAQVTGDDDARWFARVSIELVPAAGNGSVRNGGAWQQALAPWPHGLRTRVALLVAKHVWGDADFAVHAAQLFAM